ncbi:MAG: hypothetical protein M1837_001205 [Sclerophora amabilis]|nr:MAG: hypothetical protein M1837_001205 [Sclerophora amabilis]
MLYEFHRQQNTKKAGSVHATYLIGGIRHHPVEAVIVNGKSTGDGEDENMQSSPLLSSSMPNQDIEQNRVPVTSITLVREEDLEKCKTLYEKIESIHIYSLQPQTLKDLQILSDSNRDISSKYANEDPLAVGKGYGTIQNPNVKRRTGRRPMPPSAPSKNAPERPVKDKESDKQDSSQPEKSTKLASNSSSQVSASKNSAASGQSTKKGSLKRDSSNIFQSFAKSKPKPKREDTDSSIAASGEASAAEDESMKDASEDEQEDDLALLNTKTNDETERKSKAEREEQLRNMMDVEDEPMEGQESPTATSQEISNPIDATSNPEAEVEEPSIVSRTGGRRRGRRKVMKKKTVRDEEGYLVTRESPTWESFSESENEEPSKTKAFASTAPASLMGSSGKAKKSGGNPAQGNIMSFFAKK